MKVSANNFIVLSAILSLPLYFANQNMTESVLFFLGVNLIYFFYSNILSNLNPNSNLTSLSQFACRSAGCDPEILEKNCPYEIPKYFRIGLTIIFTGILAALSGGYAFFQIFDNMYLAILLGIFWGGVIFNLDCLLVMSIKKNDSIIYQIINASPRFILAIFIAVVVSKPVEIRIFQSRIKNEIGIMNDEDWRNDSTAISNKSGAGKWEQYYLKSSRKLDSLNAIANKPNTENFRLLEKSYNDAKSRYNNNYSVLQPKISYLQSMISKIENGLTSQSESANLTLYKEELESKSNIISTSYSRLIDLEQKYNNFLSDHQEKINKLINKESELNADLTSRFTVSQLKSDTLNEKAKLVNEESFNENLITQVEALDRLKSKYSIIWWTSLMITMLFMMLEISPMLVKLLSNKGLYDTIIEEITIRNSLRYQEELKKIQESKSWQAEDYRSKTEVNNLLNTEKISTTHEEIEFNKIIRKEQRNKQMEIILSSLNLWKKEKAIELESKKNDKEVYQFIELVKKAFK